MNLLQRAVYNTLVYVRAIPPGPPLTWDYFMRDGMTSATGITVNEGTALNLSPVWSGVFQLAGDVAKLPLNHNRQLPNGGKEVIGGKLHRALHDQANPEMTAFKFRECMQALCVLYGNSYAEIIRDGTGAAIGMYPIAPSRVTPIRNGEGRLVYRVTQPSGGQVFVAAENMIHGSGLSTDGVIGQNMTEHASESIGLGLAAEKFGATFFGNGATFGGVVEVPMTLAGPQGEKVKENIRTAIEAVHAGVERAHKILVLAGGSKFTQRGTAPNEAQFEETRRFQIQEVSRWLVMPPHKLGDLENAHFTNIEESEIQYWKGTVHRWLKMWEQEYRSKLIPSLERNLQSIDFNMEGELRGTSTQRAAFYKEMVGLGAYTINIVLEKEGLPTIGPTGDLHLVPLNMVPVEKYPEYIDAQIEKMKVPLPQPALPPAPDDKDKKADEDRAVLTRLDEVRAETKRLVDTVTAKLEQELREAATAAETARAGQASAEAVAAAADAARVAAEAEAQTAKDRAAEAAVALQEATERLTAALSAKDGLEASAAEQQQQIEAALADVAVKAAAVTLAEVTALDQSTLAAAQAQKAAAAEQTAQERSGEVERLIAALAAAEAARTEQERRAVEATAAHAVQQSAEAQRLTRVVTAHRALLVDAVGRIARTEAERARRRAGSPDQLRKWADAFYDEHGRDICAEMLYPAVQTHLAWKGSDDDPRAVARAMAEAYHAESVRQIRTICDGMVGDEFQTAVTRMLARWEQERPQVVADKVVSDEIAALVTR